LLGGARPDASVNTRLGKFVGARHYDHLLPREAVDVLKPDGALLLALRPGKVPRAQRDVAWPALLGAADGAAARTRKTAAGGADELHSGCVGYLHGRATGWTRTQPEGWARLVPLFQAMDRGFREEAPAYYAFLRDATRGAAHLIPGTVFSSAAVNRWSPEKNARMAVHYDGGNLPGALGALTALRSGSYSGGFLVFPRFRVAVDLRPGDLLIADNREAHGNGPIDGRDFERVSVVAFFHASNLTVSP
jgi:hypothetical protein